MFEWVIKFFVWGFALGEPIQPKSLIDDLEPYCDELTLINRERSGGEFTEGEKKAMKKIGARYGAEL